MTDNRTSGASRSSPNQGADPLSAPENPICLFAYLVRLIVEASEGKEAAASLLRLLISWISKWPEDAQNPAHQCSLLLRRSRVNRFGSRASIRRDCNPANVETGVFDWYPQNQSSPLAVRGRRRTQGHADPAGTRPRNQLGSVGCAWCGGRCAVVPGNIHGCVIK